MSNYTRECGVLLPVSSLPSRYGIGCFDRSAYEFVDFLAAAGQSCWQILPLGPTGYGDSPYQSFSTFAGNPYFISLEELIEEGVLTRQECRSVNFGNDPGKVDYAKLYKGRYMAQLCTAGPHSESGHGIPGLQSHAYGSECTADSPPAGEELEIVF